LLVRRSPVAEVVAIQRELAGLLDRIFGSEVSAGAFVPALDAYFADGHFVVRLDVAGVDPKAVEILVAGDALTVRGERKAPEVPRDDVVVLGIPYGRFERTLALPSGLDTGQVRAQWRDGILEIRIPVEQKFLPKKVPVEIAA
jgi:HSP20 family protein